MRFISLAYPIATPKRAFGIDSANLLIMVYNNSYRISRKSRNWLSAIRGIRYLRYLSVISSMIDNQELGQNIDVPTDTSSAIFIPPQKVRRN